MSDVAINLNQCVKVKLTDYGKDIYYHQYDCINQYREIITPHFPEEDSEGYSVFQLWDFMRLYGEYMSPSSKLVIQPLEIIYCEDNYVNTKQTRV